MVGYWPSRAFDQWEVSDSIAEPENDSGAEAADDYMPDTFFIWPQEEAPQKRRGNLWTGK